MTAGGQAVLRDVARGRSPTDILAALVRRRCGVGDVANNLQLRPGLDLADWQLLREMRGKLLRRIFVGMPGASYRFVRPPLSRGA